MASGSAARPPAASLEEMHEFLHLSDVVTALAAAIADARPLLADEGGDAVVEIEGRLGVLSDRGFVPDVGRDAFCSVLSLLEAFPRWHHVTGWKETQDVYYTVELEAAPGARPARMQVRTTVGLDAANNLTLLHSTKRRLRSLDLKLGLLEASRGLAAGHEVLVAADARVAVSVEQRVAADALPIAVTPDLVRIKQRKRFFVNSLGVDRPAFAIDATVVYSGKTRSEAERRQAATQEPSYEIEVECLEPRAYLQSCNQEETLLALSLVLKLLDFASALNPQKAVTYACLGRK